MLVSLLTRYYRAGLRGSYRATKLINRFYSLDDIDVDTAYGKVNVDLTLASGQALSCFRGSPEGEVIAKHARGICYDIGAHLGIYSVLMAKTGEVYAFEPNEKVFSHLRRTSEYHGFRAFNVALSDHNGLVNFYIPEEATMGSFANWTHDSDMWGITRFAGNVRKSGCVARTLDSFVAEYDLPLPNFIKIDVEGAEILVFRGGRETITQARPTIFFEVSKTLWQKLGTSHEEGFEFLNSLGYSFFIGDKEVNSLDYEWDNILAIPN